MQQKSGNVVNHLLDQLLRIDCKTWVADDRLCTGFDQDYQYSSHYVQADQEIPESCTSVMSTGDTSV